MTTAATTIRPTTPNAREVAWSVAVLDDCEGCDDPRVELTLEEMTRPGTGVGAHLAPPTARRVRAALAAALRDIGEDPGP